MNGSLINAVIDSISNSGWGGGGGGGGGGGYASAQAQAQARADAARKAEVDKLACAFGVVTPHRIGGEASALLLGLGFGEAGGDERARFIRGKFLEVFGFVGFADRFIERGIGAA